MKPRQNGWVHASAPLSFSPFLFCFLFFFAFFLLIFGCPRGKEAYVEVRCNYQVVEKEEMRDAR
jgi:hypothetical protein